MSSPIALVVGLGNPGPRYADTRHNAGFWFADDLAGSCGGTFRREAKFHGDVAQVACGGPFRILKPATFMNRSGQSVAALVRFFRFEPEQILIVHDDLDLPPGTVRLKRGGGHGGHNGLRDTMAQLGHRDFLRLRLGVGHPGSADQVLDYVLTRAPRDEQALIEEAIERAIKVFPQVLEGNLEKAMNVLHSRREATAPD
jgi:PTH1 family peptidyl-tRNA hydrolase